jgi:predicted GNAT family N-acyltransferase
MNNFNLYSLQEFLNDYSNNQVKKYLKSFKCSINKDIEEFIYNKAITFEKNLRAKTYLLIDTKMKIIAGYFSIAIAVLYAEDIDKNIILEIGNLKTPKDIPCLLIGQIAKSDEFKNVKLGNYLMDLAVEKLEEVNKIIGGRVILLDAINNKNVIKFYEKSGFFVIENDNKKESIKMLRSFYR